MTQWGIFWSNFVGKLLSARFLAVVATIGTLCFIMVRISDAVIATIGTGKDVPPVTKEILLMLIGAFISLVTGISTLYFARTDRVDRGNGEIKKEEPK